MGEGATTIIDVPPMTTEQRRSVRQVLIAAGFERSSFTQDHGDGAYSESWRNHHLLYEQWLTIRWGPKLREPDDDDEIAISPSPPISQEEARGMARLMEIPESRYIAPAEEEES